MIASTTRAHINACSRMPTRKAGTRAQADMHPRRARVPLPTQNTHCFTWVRRLRGFGCLVPPEQLFSSNSHAANC
jgi:hypothetical protein